MTPPFGHYAGASLEATVIYDGVISKVREARSNEEDLWLTPTQLTQVSGFVLKPEGACLDDLCVPIPEAREGSFLREESGQQYVNLCALARFLHQPVIHDAALAIWCFGARPQVQMRVLETLDAPTFVLPDWKGTLRALADFRGRKVVLITWASW